MASPDLSRKRRKIQADAVPSNSPGGADTASSSTSKGLYLDDEAIRRSMLQMMTAKEANDGESDEESEEEGDEDDDRSNDSESEAAYKSKPVGEDFNSDNEADEQDAILQNAPKAAIASRVTSRAFIQEQVKPKIPLKTSFESLGLLPPLISALASISILKPTEIQSACVGPILSGEC
jgi:ATP-dependent RNA helicase DDX49/DBP8